MGRATLYCTPKTLRRQKLCQSKDLEIELVRCSVIHFEASEAVLNKITKIKSKQIKSVISEKPVSADKIPWISISYHVLNSLHLLLSTSLGFYAFDAGNSFVGRCPCCTPRKQHLDSCRWMMSKQALHFFLKIGSGILDSHV